MRSRNYEQKHDVIRLLDTGQLKMQLEVEVELLLRDSSSPEVESVMSLCWRIGFFMSLLTILQKESPKSQ